MDWRIGVAIGNQVLDLKRARLIESYDINRIMRLAHEPRRALRAAISDGLRRCVSWNRALSSADRVAHVAAGVEYLMGRFATSMSSHIRWPNAAHRLT